ncbi:MAG TPA: translation elongation factor Ts [Rectinemataceae bacterium]|nr:translation elongation factor Ts [Rectinemataceae bacterium]
MAITAKDIKALRQKTGAGMMACKRALEESGGDEGGAEALLKERGLVEVEKRADRATLEGRVFVHQDEGKAALLALACETDFVARNELFVAAGARMAALACAGALRGPDSAIEALVSELAGLIKENIAVKGMAFFEAGPDESLDAYVHGEGGIGVVVKASIGARGQPGSRTISPFLHDLALHVAAFDPLYVEESKIPESYRQEREAAFREEMAEDQRLRGKPEKMLEGILSGKLRKHFASISLLDQNFVKDETISVAEALRRQAAEAGIAFSITDFARLSIKQ